MSSTLPHSEEIEILEENVMDELNRMVQHKKEYMNILKKNYKQKNIGIKKNDRIQIQLYKSGEKIECIGYPMLFYTQEQEKTITMYVDIHQDNQLLFRKELILPKTINIDEHMEKMDTEIDKQNLIIKMKNIMDKMNTLNTVSDKETFIQENGDIYDKNTLEEILIKYRKEYTEIKEIYTPLSEKRNQLGRIKKKLYSDADQEQNTLQQIDFCKHPQGLHSSSCKDITIQSSPVELKLNITELDTTDIKPRIKITRHFEGRILKNNKKTSTSTYIPPVAVSKKINIGDLKADLNIDQSTRFIIGASVNSTKPGNGIDETILDENRATFSSLERYGDWRRKLSDAYIHKIGINPIPIIIDGQYFASITHYGYYLAFNNRQDVSDELKIYYQEFADNLLLHTNGIHSKKNKGRLDTFIREKKLLMNSTVGCDFKKAYYAKYTQNTELNQLLQDTHNSLLIYKEKGSYYANNDLMYIRDLLIMGRGLVHYENMESDMALWNRFKENNFVIPTEDIPLGGIWVNTYLPILKETINFPRYDYNRHTIPSHARLWVDRQKRYYENYTDDETKEIIRLMTIKSMKLFNNIIDKTPGQRKIPSQFTKDKLMDFIKKINKYTADSPKNNEQIVIYSGIDREYYEKIKDDEEFTTNRFMSATFNKEYANHYASLIGTKQKPGRGYYSRKNNKPFIVYNITIPEHYNKIFYVEQENQIVFLPGVIFRKQKENVIGTESVSRIEGDTNTRRKISVENVFYEIVQEADVREEVLQETKTPTPYEEQINILKEKGLYKRGMSDKDIQDRLLKVTSKDTASILVHIKQMEKIAEENNLEVVDMPPDGDCAYYTITHGLHQHGVPPMNFDIENSEHEFGGTSELPVKYGDSETKKPIFVNATTQIRRLLAYKLEANLENPSEYVSRILEGVSPGLMNDRVKLNKYIDDIRYMVNSKETKTGDWGDINSFILASALFNVNFTIYSGGMMPIEINAATTRPELQNGVEYNDDYGQEYIPPTIHVGYYMGKHYVLLKPIPQDQIGKGVEYDEDCFEKRVYHIIDVNYDNKDYQIVFYVDHDIDCVERTVGIYDKEREIWDQGNDENRWTELSKKAIDEYDNATQMEKIFYIDISDNNVFNPNNINKPIGTLKKCSEDGHFYIYFLNK